MAYEIANLLQALGKFTSVGAFIAGKGFAAGNAGHPGNGQYTVTLQDGIDVTERIVNVTSNTPAQYAAIDESLGTDTTIAVRTYNAAGVETDGAFSVEVLRLT